MKDVLRKALDKYESLPNNISYKTLLRVVEYEDYTFGFTNDYCDIQDIDYIITYLEDVDGVWRLHREVTIYPSRDEDTELFYDIDEIRGELNG